MSGPAHRRKARPPRKLFNHAGGPTTYVIYIEFYHSVGAPNLDLAITSSKFSYDDSGLNNVAVNCNWGVYEGRRTNSRPYSWNSAVGLDSNNFPNNQRCHLELRGYIDLSDAGSYSLNDTPALMFWHIWDLNPNTGLAGGCRLPGEPGRHHHAKLAGHRLGSQLKHAQLRVDARAHPANRVHQR